MSNIMNTRAETAGDEDLEYVMLCQKGDPEAFEVLVERHQKKMLNIAYRMIGDYDEACDVTQEAFVAAYKSIRQFKAEAKFSTWLYRIVVNYSKNRLKQLSSRSRREGFSIDNGGNMQDGRVCDQAMIHESNPGTQMEQREREAHVQKCISALD